MQEDGINEGPRKTAIRLLVSSDKLIEALVEVSEHPSEYFIKQGLLVQEMVEERPFSHASCSRHGLHADSS